MNAKNKIDNKKPVKQTAVHNDDDIFSGTPTELLGLDKRQLLSKINQYKALFPNQLKSFKIKKNPSVENLFFESVFEIFLHNVK